MKKGLWHRCFPVNFTNFLRTPFLQNNSGLLLLYAPKYLSFTNENLAIITNAKFSEKLLFLFPWHAYFACVLNRWFSALMALKSRNSTSSIDMLDQQFSRLTTQIFPNSLFYSGVEISVPLRRKPAKFAV